MIIYYCKEDIVSNNKKIIYAQQGDEVFIISNHHPALVVGKFNGEKFPCNINKLSQTKILKNESKDKNVAETNRNRKNKKQ